MTAERSHMEIRRLACTYATWLLLCFLAVAGLWRVGIEAIYKHVTPFYALLNPVKPFGPSSALGWHLPVLFVTAAGFVLLTRALRRPGWLEEETQGKNTAKLLLCMVAAAFVFAAALAMVRGGPHGISQAFTRARYEAIGDIGVGGSIRGLFGQYNRVHDHLSLHSRAHPPGPVTILWLLSYVVGRSPGALSVAVMFLGSLAIVPLYFWARDMTGHRAAVTCCLLYMFVPSVALFGATSMDIAFTPFTLAALLFFWRALHRQSIPYAIAAGGMYALLSLTHFSLLILGAYFVFVSVWRLRDDKLRGAVFVNAVIMFGAFCAVHFAVRAWTGFDVVACMKACKANIDYDRAEEMIHAPRYSMLAWRFLNPLAWLIYAGVPVTILFFKRLRHPEAETKALFIILAATAAVLALLYLGKGEGERSALYVFPFLTLPAAHYLSEASKQARSNAPLLITLAFLALQCWVMEALLYTYW